MNGALVIFVLQPRDVAVAAMLVINTIKIISKNLHENGVKFSEDINVSVLDHQRGCHDFTCKPAIIMSILLLASDQDLRRRDREVHGLFL